MGGVGEKEGKAAGRGGLELVDSHSASRLHSRLLTASKAQQLQVRQKLLLTETAADCKVGHRCAQCRSRADALGLRNRQSGVQDGRSTRAPTTAAAAAAAAASGLQFVRLAGSDADAEDSASAKDAALTAADRRSTNGTGGTNITQNPNSTDGGEDDDDYDQDRTRWLSGPAPHTL